jgi:UDP-glucose 4-epimerase
VSFVAERIGRLTGKSSTLNTDKYNIMRQRSWRCDITPAEVELGYKPAYNLERGVAETIAWYKREGWL